MSAWEALTSQVSAAIREFKRVSAIPAENLYAEEVQRQVAEASAAIEEAANRQREYFAADEAAATAERKAQAIIDEHTRIHIEQIARHEAR